VRGLTKACGYCIPASTIAQLCDALRTFTENNGAGGRAVVGLELRWKIRTLLGAGRGDEPHEIALGGFEPGVSSLYRQLPSYTTPFSGNSVVFLRP
jgi:hypothetical protein